MATAAETHRAAVAATVCGGFVLWCVLALLAAVQAGRAVRSREEADGLREEAVLTRARVAELRADLSATHTAAAGLRAALATAQAAADGARTDLVAVQEALAATGTAAAEARERAEAEQAALRETAERAETALRALTEESAAEREQLAALSVEVLPQVVERLRGGASVDSVLVPHRSSAHAGLLRYVAEEIGRGERQRAAALAVCATAAGRVQALATSMHAELREMQHRHGEDVLGDLLVLDHSTAQAGRMADSIAVLTGARSGRRWAKPIAVESILRGALGRIGAYQRVRLHSASTAAVAGYAAEGVMHALAELLDNAANFSAPPAEVHVYVEEAHAGLVITVEDGGLGLSDSWLKRAERAVSPEPLDLTALSAGTRIGLAVVGALARKHGLSVSFRPSARGGTGVVMLIPAQLITHPAPEPAATGGTMSSGGTVGSGRGGTAVPAVTRGAGAAAAVTRGEGLRGRAAELTSARSGAAELPAAQGSAALPTRTSVSADAAGAAPAAGGGDPTAEGGNGLPQRRRGQTLASARQGGAATRAAVPPQPVPPRPGAPRPATPRSAALFAAGAAGAAAGAAAPTGSAGAAPLAAAARFGAFRRALQPGAESSGGAGPAGPADSADSTAPAASTDSADGPDATGSGPAGSATNGSAPTGPTDTDVLAKDDA
ncbi:ATP-binding protein [Kitasatospora sp. MMS16-BH015]|uniref:sensor histidine kinase n=1 Tax=Kitasatospora sp. MMS16-BH015 TaxID=2018025 RepID=UPI0020C1BEAE|nr:ATP-binding protein [Kitasatospora sp. MMS16-BH015]